MENKISVIILTYNCQRSIKNTLESVIEFDEIIIIDCGSEDKTLEIIKTITPQTTIYHNNFESFSTQRNYGISKATNKWCLFIDSDETITSELKDELYKLIKIEKKYPLYRIMRTEYIFHQEIKYGHGRSLYQERFFDKTRVSYQGIVHEYPVIDNIKPAQNSSEVFNIDPNKRMQHDPTQTVERMIQKVAPYATLMAKEKIQKGKSTNAFMVLLAFIGTFVQIYVKSFRDGRRGFAAAILESLNRGIVKLLIYEQSKIKNKNN